jgi:short-subunit dehydrogenase
MGFFSTRSNILDSPRSGTNSTTRAWALVTGATSGIGRDITQELCIRGFNVIVHGRNASRLDELCELLRVDYGVGAEPLLLDAATAFNIDSATVTREKLTIQSG